MSVDLVDPLAPLVDFGVKCLCCWKPMKLEKSESFFGRVLRDTFECKRPGPCMGKIQVYTRSLRLTRKWKMMTMSETRPTVSGQRILEFALVTQDETERRDALLEFARRLTDPTRRHCTLWGRFFDIGATDTRENAAQWLASEIELGLGLR
jgi:hypothetical protein